MDEKLLEKLLRSQKEEDWFDFKRKLKIFHGDGQRNDDLRDELIKDILGMANGNSHIIKKTKHLIIGVDDEKFDKTGLRVLHDVNYPVPSKSDLNDWLKSACEPPVTGIEVETICFNSANIFIISIPPTFDLHETRRELITPKRFNEHTVFMRQGDNTVPASVKEGVTIQQLKHLHRREIENPSAGWAGGIAGGVVSYLILGSSTSSANSSVDFSNPVIRILLILFGSFMGAMIGDLSRFIRSVWFDWPFMTLKGKLIFVSYFAIALPGLYFLISWLVRLSGAG